MSITHFYSDIDLMDHKTYLTWIKSIERPLLIVMVCRSWSGCIMIFLPSLFIDTAVLSHFAKCVLCASLLNGYFNSE